MTRGTTMGRAGGLSGAAHAAPHPTPAKTLRSQVVTSRSRQRDAEVAADLPCKVVRHFGVPRHRAGEPVRRVPPHGVRGSFAAQRASVLPKVSKKAAALHERRA